MTPKNDMERRNRIAQWAFDTRPILGRFHLWLDDVEIEWVRGDDRKTTNQSISFVDENMERLFIMTAAVTALGTRLFAGCPLCDINQNKHVWHDPSGSC